MTASRDRGPLSPPDADPGLPAPERPSGQISPKGAADADRGAAEAAADADRGAADADRGAAEAAADAQLVAGEPAEPAAASYGSGAPAGGMPGPATATRDAAPAYQAARHEPASAPPADGAASHEEHEEEEGGRSIASRLLVALVLLIAGAALGIWGAPRLAPHLPAGMAPVAAWLAPGGSAAEERIATLEAETRAEIGELRGALAAVPAEDDIAARLAEVEAGLSAEVGALRDDLQALDGAETRDRLSRLEAALDGQASQLASLGDQLAAVDDIEGSAAQIDVYQAELEGLRGEIRDVAGQIGGLSRRIDEVAAEADRRVEAAETRAAEVEEQSAAAISQAELAADLQAIRAALVSGAPYPEPAERLAEAGNVELPAALADRAEAGVPTLAALRDRFGDAAHAAIRASIEADAGEGLGSRARAFFEAQVASRSLEPREGADTDAVLSRMEAALRRDDLAAAVAEGETLPPEAEAAMSGWLADARARLAAVEGLSTLEADASAMN